MESPQTFEQFLTTQIPHIALGAFVVDLLLTAILIIILGVVYDRYGSALSNRKAFARNLVVVGMTTMLIITIVKSSLALSLGLVGALSIVRFRTPIKEPEELAYLFLSIAIGLGLGAGQRAVVTIGLVIIGSIIWVFHFRRTSFDSQGMHLSVSSIAPAPGLLNDIVKVLHEHSSTVRLRRVDEAPESFQSDFAVSFDNYEQLNKAKLALKSVDENLEVSFLDDRTV